MNKKFLIILLFVLIVLILALILLIDFKENLISGAAVRITENTYTNYYSGGETFTYEIPSNKICDITWKIKVEPNFVSTYKLETQTTPKKTIIATDEESWKSIQLIGVTQDTVAIVSCHTSCDGGYTLSASRSCTASCTNECTPSGSTQCVGSTKQTCGNYDVDSCLEWGGNDDCSDCSCTCGDYGKSSESGYCSDGIDNDCDFLTDSADPDCELGDDCIDNDNDGYGAKGTNLSKCSSSTSKYDCNDINAKIHPEATEVCGDAKDNDCDEDTDCDDTDCNDDPACEDYVKPKEDKSPEVTLKEPHSGHKDTDGEINFVYVASDDDGINFCSLIVNKEVVASDITVPNKKETYFNSKGLGDGYYLWKVECRDTGENEQASETRNFTVILESSKIAIKPIYISSNETEIEEIIEEPLLKSNITIASIVIIAIFTVLIITFMIIKAKKLKIKT